MRATLGEVQLAQAFHGADEGGGIAGERQREVVGLTLDLAVSGDHTGQITYRHNTATDAMTLNGTYDGKVVSTPRPVP